MNWFENMDKLLDLIISVWDEIEDAIDIDNCETMKNYHIPRIRLKFRNHEVIGEINK